MEYLLFSILLAMALAMLFKIIGRLNIPLLVVVPMNYLTCTVTGFAFSAPQIPILELLQSAWLETALLQGLFFYASFSLLALASQRIGLAISALFSRIAMVVPVMVSFWLLGDEVTVNKLCGIAAAIIAMVLLLNNQKPSQRLSPKKPAHTDPGSFLSAWDPTEYHEFGATLLPFQQPDVQCLYGHIVSFRLHAQRPGGLPAGLRRKADSAAELLLGRSGFGGM
jgi:multidrug transporter EmrE-like cation transporter